MLTHKVLFTFIIEIYISRGTLGDNKADYRELIDAALLAIAQNNYKEAYKHFENASLLDSNKVMVCKPSFVRLKDIYFHNKLY